MNVDIIFRIAGVGLLVSILNQVLIKSGRDEIAVLTTLAGLVLVLLMVVDMVSGLFQSVRTVFQFQ